MKDFEYYSPVRIIFGDNRLNEIGTVLKGTYKRVLLVLSKGPFRVNGVYDRVKFELEKANIQMFEMSDIDSNPRLSSVQEGMNEARKNNVDCVLAIGGGSAMDCAKVIGASAKTGIDPFHYLWGDRKAIDASLDVITVPTIAATGTEVNPYSVIVNDETKEKYYCEAFYPKIAIMDPVLTASVPKKLTIWGAMDILSHTFEFYFNGETNSEFQLRFSEGIIHATMKAIEILAKTPDDINARGELMWCAVMAWGGLTKIGRGDPDMACHGLEESFSGWFDTHHGACLGVLTPRWMECTAPAVPKPFARFGREIFQLNETDDTEAAKQAVQRYKEWLKRVDAPNTYSDIGNKEFSDEGLIHVAETACRIYGGSVGHLKKFNLEQSIELLKLGNVAY